jgi:hypothetical protein
MGAGASSLPSGADDMSKTLNFILQEMFRRTDLADIYSLADPERCKRYIVVATDALESLFIKMRVYPNKTKDGTFYLQSIDGLLKAMPADVRAKQREYCVELSFFFIRIFQIFGALFLSMYDSQLPVTDPTVDTVRDSPAKGIAFLNPKDFLGFSSPPPKQTSWFGSGGELINDNSEFSFYIDDKNSPYFILNYSLNRRPNLRDIQDMDFDSNEFAGTAKIKLIQDTLYDITDNSRTVKDNPRPDIRINFERNGNIYTLKASLIINIISNNNTNIIYNIQLINFKLYGNSLENTTFQNINVEPENLVKNLETNEPPISTGNKYPSTRNRKLPSVLKAMFDKAILKGMGEPPFSVYKFFQKIRYIRGEDSSRSQLITGTKIYLLKGQENESRPKIAYIDKIKFKGEDTAKEVTITARLGITKVKESANSIQVVYNVTLDFTSADVNPSAYRGLLSIPTVVKTLRFKAISEDVAPTSDVNDLSIPEFLERIFTEVKSDSYADTIKGFKTRDGLVIPYDSEQIPPELKVKKLWQAMAKDPPVKSHCIARAVQLLSLDAIKGNLKDARSSICRFSFKYQVDGSLPTPGKPVIEESGIYALSLLFFEGLNKNSPKIIDEVAYKNYLRYLKYLFEHYPSIDKIKDERVEPGKVPGPDAIPRRLDEIREKSLKMCESHPNEILSLPPNLAGNLRSVTSNLFSQQRAHFQKALTIIFSIFDRNSVEREKKLKFNPRIIAGGMPEIDRISNETRILLLEYYKGCELTYRDGLLMIYNYEKQSGKRLEGRTVEDVQSNPSGTRTLSQENNPRNPNNGRDITYNDPRSLY